MPVWDKYVLQNMGIEIKRYSLKKCVECYKKILEYYDKMEMSGEANELIKMFDDHFPQYKDKFTRIKKMDLMLWQRR